LTDANAGRSVWLMVAIPAAFLLVFFVAPNALLL